MKKVLIEAFVTCALVLGVAACGDDEPESRPAAQTTPPAEVTPVPSHTPAPSPEAELHETVTPTPTATPDTGGAEAGEEAGDEEGISVPVDVTVTEERIRASTDTVAAFLPLRFSVTSRVDRELQVVVVRSGEGGGPVARLTVPAGGDAAADVEGLQPGHLEVLSPDMDPDATAIIEVKPGG